MGADQIGYLVVGPAKLDPEKVASVKERLKKAHAHIRASDMGDMDMDLDNEALKDAVGELGVILDFPSLFRFLDYETMTMGDLTSEDFLDKFVAWWNDGCSARDVASRAAPHDPNLKIVFAGEMTWGDAPDGYGYAMLSCMATWGLLEQLGIE